MISQETLNEIRKALEALYPQQDNSDEMEGLSVMAEELVTLRKEVAQYWFYRRYEKPYKVAEKVKEHFIGMPLDERKGKSSNQILNELFKKYNK